ncbi:sensor histidine kinase [Roseicella sp. DB1501]|uniref:sensor histidine kinase n=1 Tax=Roseicella sp. DB1501 TaxID=2730925 RepID=UPI0014929403|nr:sensor histidine kinase [Roseicella sp. DB1501]NOG70185.1 sensor histidine kinase [Roseicella sp. DB1501]
MTQALLSLASALAPGPAPGPAPVADGLFPRLTATEFRQLRHQTKNALQRILFMIDAHPALRQTEASRAVAADLHRRILLTAEISDALFGLTHEPAPFAERLAGLCEAMTALLGAPGQDIRLRLRLAEPCPEPLQEAVLRVAHELVGNAVKHGLYARLAGEIEVRLENDGSELRLLVLDDGWGWTEPMVAGEGLSLARVIATREAGRVTLDRKGNRTVAMLALPLVDAPAG